MASVKTRAGIYYGDSFSTVCRALEVSATDLDKRGIASKGTCTKLNRRFKGAAVEAPTRDRIIDYFREIASKKPGLADRLSERGATIEGCIIPAHFRLSDAGCALLSGIPVKLGGILNRDRLTVHQVGLLAKGHFGVRKHVEAVARQALATKSLEDSIESFIEEHSDDDHACFPTAYVRGNASRQLTLLRGSGA